MGSDKGVLARAIAGGFKGGTAALRKTDELKEKFAWGDEQARQARQLNLERFGQAKELATHQSNLGVSAAQTKRKQVRGEGISAVQQGLQAQMEAMGTDPVAIKEAVQLAGAGLSAAVIQGTPGKPLTAEATKQIAEAVDKLMPDALPEEKLAAASELEAKITAGTYGIQRAATAAKEGRAFDKAAAAKKKILDKATDGFMKVLTNNPDGAITHFGSIVAGDPVRATDLLNEIEAKGTVDGHVIKKMRKMVVAASKRKIGAPTKEPVSPVLARSTGGMRTPGDVVAGIKEKANEPSDLEGVLSFSGRDRI